MLKRHPRVGIACVAVLALVLPWGGVVKGSPVPSAQGGAGRGHREVVPHEVKGSPSLDANESCSWQGFAVGSPREVCALSLREGWYHFGVSWSAHATGKVELVARDDERRWLWALCTTKLGRNERCSLEIGQQVNLDSDPPEPYGPDGYRVGLLRDMSLTITVLPWLCPSGDACGSDVPVSTGEFEFRIDPADPF